MRFQLNAGEAPLRVGFNTDISDIRQLPKRTHLQVIRLAKEGALSRAMARMAAAEMAEPTPENRRKLQALHPQRPPPQGPPPRNLDVRVEPIPAWEVKRLLRSFPPCSAAGGSGLTPAHLLQFVNSIAADGAEAVARVVDLIADGSVPEGARQFFFGARLFALAKKDGGLRPIACGDVFRRLAGKWLMQKVRPSITPELLPHQVGVGCKNGADIAVQCVRMYARYARSAGGIAAQRCVMTIDIRNAFNTLDRAKLLDVVAEKLPKLLNYTLAAYGLPTLLGFGDSCLFSATGTQQGDPPGPLYFSACLAEAMKDESVRRQIEALDAKAAYLDDLTLCGELRHVLAAFEALRPVLAAMGLEINASKTKIYAHPDAQLPADLPVERLSIDELVILGVPCGVGEGLTEALVGAVNRFRSVVNMVSRLENHHVALALLHFCASGAVLNHLLRGFGSHRFGEVCDGFVSDAIGQICGGVMPPLALQQARSPQRFGGLGIRFMHLHAAGAHAVSVRRAIEGANIVCRPGIVAAFRADLLVAVERLISKDPLYATTPALAARLLEPLRLDPAAGAPPDMSRTISDAIETARFEHRLAALPTGTSNADRRARAHARVVTAKYSALWMYSSVRSSCAPLWLENPEFLVAIRLRLGIPLAAEPQRCDFCQVPAVSDIMGDHSCSCMSGGSRTLLHHSIVREIMDLANHARTLPRCEAHPFVGDADQNLRIDVLIRMPQVDLSAGLIDVAVTHPVGVSYLSRAAALVPAGIATEYEQIKQRHYSAAVDRLTSRAPYASAKLLPVVFDTFGGFSKTCVETLKTLARLWADNAGLATSTAVLNVMHRLNFVVVRAVARLASANAANSHASLRPGVGAAR